MYGILRDVRGGDVGDYLDRVPSSPELFCGPLKRFVR